MLFSFLKGKKDALEEWLKEMARMLYFSVVFILNIVCDLIKNVLCPGWVAQLVLVSSLTPKGWGFDSQSGHKPRLPV